MSNIILNEKNLHLRKNIPIMIYRRDTKIVAANIGELIYRKFRLEQLFCFPLLPLLPDFPLHPSFLVPSKTFQLALFGDKKNPPSGNTRGTSYS